MIGIHRLDCIVRNLRSIEGFGLSTRFIGGVVQEQTFSGVDESNLLGHGSEILVAPSDIIHEPETKFLSSVNKFSQIAERKRCIAQSPGGHDVNDIVTKIFEHIEIVD
jgi:hypothetical protein